MKKVIAIIALIFSASYTLQPAYAYDGSIVGKVTGMRYYNNRILLTHDNMANPGNCSDTAYLYLSYTSAGFDQFNAALMTALASGLTAQLMLTGCSNGGTSGYPVIEQVWIKQ